MFFFAAFTAALARFFSSLVRCLIAAASAAAHASDLSDRAVCAGTSALRSRRAAAFRRSMIRIANTRPNWPMNPAANAARTHFRTAQTSSHAMMVEW